MFFAAGLGNVRPIKNLHDMKILRSAVAVLLTTTVLLSSNETLCQKLPRALILTGNGNIPTHKKEYPPWIHEFQNETVVDILKDIAAVEITEDLEVLTTSRLQEFDLIISNSIFLTPTPEQLDGLYKFVANGKSYLTLHCGILSLLNWDRYEEFIGGIFIGGPSSVPAEFKVMTANTEFWGYQYSFRDATEHPISAVMDDFVTKDELYFFQPSTRNFHVIARAENLPVMWWHPVGKGKVMSLTLGHDQEAKENPGYKELLRNGAKWLTGLPLISGKQPRIVSTRTLSYENFMSLKAFVSSDRPQQLQFGIDANKSPDLFSVESTGSGNVNLRLKGVPGDGSFVAAVRNADSHPSKKVFDVLVVADGAGNIASYHGNTAVSSSNENQSDVFRADNVLDGDQSTRWSSAPGETAWLTIDLKKEYPIKKIVLQWEASFATQYSIEGSRDGKKWNRISTVSQGDGKIDTHEFTVAAVRFVRINMQKRFNERWGYSLYEVEVYE